MKKIEIKNFNQADEVREFPHGKVELVMFGDQVVGKLTLLPGWRWTNDVKAIAGTELCEAPHFQYQASGRLGVLTDDGKEHETNVGDVVKMAAGHDAWVIGDEPVVLIDWHGATHYAEK
jgi:hypothetical protein